MVKSKKPAKSPEKKKRSTEKKTVSYVDAGDRVRGGALRDGRALAHETVPSTTNRTATGGGGAKPVYKTDKID